MSNSSNQIFRYLDIQVCPLSFLVKYLLPTFYLPSIETQKCMKHDHWRRQVHNLIDETHTQTNHIRDHNNDRDKDKGGFRRDINYAMFVLSQGVGQQGFPEESESEVAQSCLTFMTPWTVAYQAPLSMGFSRQEHWRGLPFPSPGDLPDPGIKPGSPALQADSLPAKPPGKPRGS